VVKSYVNHFRFWSDCVGVASRVHFHATFAERKATKRSRDRHFLCWMSWPFTVHMVRPLAEVRRLRP
jgi:hypothetical protein